MDNQKPDKYEIIPHQHFRDLSREQKIQHVLDYYLLHIIGAAVLLIAIVSVVIYFTFQYRRTQLYAMCVDVSTEQTQQLTGDYAAYAAMNTRKYAVVWDDADYRLGGQDEYNVMTKIMTLIGAEAADILLYSDADADTFLTMEAAADLKRVLPDALYAQAESDGLVQMGLPPADVEAGAKSIAPYAFALDITDTAFAARYGLQPLRGERLYLSVTINSKRMDEAVRFVAFILGA
ncbi:MAG: hypothetical protein J5482_04910 [Oscillospiraceae bacterium]|nr:hypothetical protein [Oscillospiraceae bacterium]